MRSKNLFVAVAFLVFGMAGLSQLSGEEEKARTDPDPELIRRGYQISPVPLKLRGRNRDLVGLGSYIVNAQGGCNDCHTNPSYEPGGNPFEGEPERINTENYLAGGTAFGPFVSRNITPDASGKPAGLTFQEFRSVMRRGRHDADEPLLQVMPWPVYRHMTDRDLKAIYEYLSAIPHAEPGGN